MTTEKKYTLEPCYKIWNENTGSRLELGIDQHSYDAVQLQIIDETNTRMGTVLINIDEIEPAMQALEALQNWIRDRKASQ